MKKPTTILITGCAGFIGQSLSNHLIKRYPEYHILGLDALLYPAVGWQQPDSKNFEFVRGDICNEELMETLVSQSDVVVHLAAETHVPRSLEDSLRFLQTNVIGTQVVTHLVAKYRDKVSKYLYVSSSEVYGDATGPKMDEMHPLCPHTPYAASKAGADRLVSSYRISHDIPAIILRPFNNYGPGQHLEKVIPRFISHCVQGSPIELHGGGEMQRDWLYVEDHCEAIDSIIHADDSVIGETFNIGTETSASIKTLAEVITDLLRRQVEFVRTEDRPGQVVRHTADSRKIREATGWVAKTKLRDGLEKTVRWYLENQTRWEPQWSQRLVPVTTPTGSLVWY